MESLKYFSFQFSNGMDRHVEEVSRSKSIQRLLIDGSDITDRCLRDISRMKQLKWFAYGETSFTDAGIKLLRGSRPDLRIQGELPVAEREEEDRGRGQEEGDRQ